MLVIQCRMFCYNFIGFFRHGFIQILARLIVLIDGIGFFNSRRKIFFCQQIYCFLTVLNTTRSIDAWPYLKHDVAHCKLSVIKSTHINDSFQSNTGIAIELFQTMVS